MTDRKCIGFDLRVRPSLQIDDPSRASDWLQLANHNPISIDRSVWHRWSDVDFFTDKLRPGFYYPLNLAGEIERPLAMARAMNADLLDMQAACFTLSPEGIVLLSARLLNILNSATK